MSGKGGPAWQSKAMYSSRGRGRKGLFREVNERIEEIGRDARLVDGKLLCECANTECAEPIPLTLTGYEAVRRIPSHFLVAPEHDVPAIERVVEANQRYVVVEKVGEAGAAAARLEPRGRSSERSWTTPVRIRLLGADVPRRTSRSTARCFA